MDLTKTMLNMALGGGTWVLVLLIILSIASVAVMLERFCFFYRGRFAEKRFIAEVEPLLAEEAWTEAAAKCETARGFEPRVLLAGLAQVHRGRQAAEEAMEAERIRLGQTLEKHLGFLGTMGANSPFIGLFGTVLGIIHAFKDMALCDSGGGPAVMAGIAEALVATAVGLLVAIPAVMAYNFFHRRLHAVLERSRRLSRILLTYLHGPAPAGQVAEVQLHLHKTGRKP